MTMNHESSSESQRAGVDRRQHQRLDLTFPVTSRGNADLTGGREIRTRTRNVSAGGIYFESAEAPFDVGERIDVELVVPAAEGVSRRPGKARSRAEVIRIDRLGGNGQARYGVAARFLDRLRTSI